MRALARPYTRHLISDSMLTSFRVDYWVDGGALIEQYSDQAIYDLGMGTNVKVLSSFIHVIHCVLSHPGPEILWSRVIPKV